MNPVLPHIITWLLIFVSIGLVAGITYLYTNRDKQITAILTILAILVVLFIKLIAIVDIELSRNFLGRFDVDNRPYIVAEPGWKLLLHTWHIWIIPVFFVSVTAGAIIYMLVYAKKSKIPDVKLYAPPAREGYVMTRAEKLNTMMLVDAAKKEARDVNEKLADVLLANAAYEIQISDLNTRIEELESQLEEMRKNLTEEIEILELELSAKNKENEYISEQLSERSQELILAQEKLEKIALSTRKNLSGDFND